MAKIVIFGEGEMAQVANFYFSRQSPHEVVGFTVDSQFRKTDQVLGLPLVDFEDLEKRFPQENHQLFIAIGYSRLNRLREQKFLEAKRRGYSLASFISERCTNLTDFPFGENCFILEDNTIQPFVKIGNNVTLWSGNHIGHHSQIMDSCFIASHVVISGGVTIGERCFIGVNSTLRDHIAIGKDCLIGAGSLILEDAPDGSVYTGQASKRSPVPSNRIRNI